MRQSGLHLHADGAVSQIALFPERPGECEGGRVSKGCAVRGGRPARLGMAASGEQAKRRDDGDVVAIRKRHDPAEGHWLRVGYGDRCPFGGGSVGANGQSALAR